MATTTKKRPSTTRSSTKAETATSESASETPVAPAPEPAGAALVPADDDAYELPVIHTRVPAELVEVTFWSALGGAALVGVVSPPAAMMIGAGVLVARHRLHRT